MGRYAIIVVNSRHIGIVVHNEFVFLKLICGELDFSYHFSGTLFDFLFALIRNMGDHRVLGLAVLFALFADLYFEAEKLSIVSFQIDNL